MSHIKKYTPWQLGLSVVSLQPFNHDDLHFDDRRQR
ncbi:hypothetical protein GGP62_003320 [Salinibacter ruber]|nr:hypothetical protein [Salinibacter ruber]